MRTVNIGELRDQLSAYLQLVRDAEEVVVRDKDVPVARILPFKPGLTEHEAKLEINVSLGTRRECLALATFRRSVCYPQACVPSVP